MTARRALLAIVASLAYAILGAREFFRACES